MGNMRHGYSNFDSYMDAVDVALQIELGKDHKEVANFDWYDYFWKLISVEDAVHKFLDKNKLLIGIIETIELIEQEKENV